VSYQRKYAIISSQNLFHVTFIAALQTKYISSSFCAPFSVFDRVCVPNSEVKGEVQFGSKIIAP
jgi:hypothetical protein